MEPIPCKDYCRPIPSKPGACSCCRFPEQTSRIGLRLPIQQEVLVDNTEPIVIEWPPSSPSTIPPACEGDTGPRPDLLAMIPDQIVPQVVTIQGVPSPTTLTYIDPSPHPLCPDGEVHMRIEPKEKRNPCFRWPGPKPTIRGPPNRPWIQCVENSLINDQVRRPLARCCFKRPVPPLVIPTFTLQELQRKSTERQREREEAGRRCRERECLRLASRDRHGKWNYTVESLLERKRRNEREKEEREKEVTRKLIEEVEREKREQSNAEIEKAKKLMLYRKGLIRDFHSALAYSKMMQEIEEDKNKREKGQRDAREGDEDCMEKMMRTNERGKDCPSKDQGKKCSDRLLARLKCIEERSAQQEKELQFELRLMKQEIADNLPELSGSKDDKPECDEGDKRIRQQQRNRDVHKEISDKLAVNAFIESHENEVDRQACEYNAYKRQVDAIRKAKEKQLIEEKVAYNIARSEAAAKVLVEMQSAKSKREDEYSQLKDKWTSEWEEKKEENKRQHERKIDKIVEDFERRQSIQCDPVLPQVGCGLHPARLWARELLVAEENFERECEEKTKKKKAAQDVLLYNKALAAEQHCKEQRRRYLDEVHACKMKQSYVDEMQEMKSYAQKCMQDWAAKGRSLVPMQQAMKKWDYDSDMTPQLFLGAGDCSGPSTLKDEKTCKGFETTSKRLGFGSGGC